MILIEKHPDGYALKRTDTPLAEVIIVSEDELAETVAALFDDELGGYAEVWDQMAAAPLATAA